MKTDNPLTLILLVALAIFAGYSLTARTDPAPVVQQPAAPIVIVPAPGQLQATQPAQPVYIPPTADYQPTVDAYYTAQAEQAQQPQQVAPFQRDGREASDPFAHVTPGTGMQTCEGLSCNATPNAGGMP